MATRTDLKNEFWADLRIALPSSIPDDHIATRGDAAGIPAVVYSEMVRKRSVNDATGPVPAKYSTDVNGDKTTAHYPSYWTGRFDVQCKADEEPDKDSLFENVLGKFLSYDDGWLHPNKFHPDCSDVRVIDQRDADEQSDSVKGDFVTVEFDYTKWLDRDGTPITTINQTIDADTDSSTTNGNTYTTQ